MNDLKTLFGSTETPESSERSSSTGKVGVAALRSLVGAPSPQTESAQGVKSTGIQALVGDSSPSRPAGATVSLRTLVGGDVSSGLPSRTADLSVLMGDGVVSPASSTPAALTALVGESTGRAIDEGWIAPELAQAGRRPMFGGRRKAGAVNYLSIAAAALAVIVLVGTASFAVVQRATANPADDAMISLREREAELANETNVLRTAADLYAASVAEGAALAENSQPVLTALQGRTPGAPLAAAENARIVLAQTAASATAVSVPVYSRGSIDEESLADVAKAIDGVRLSRDALPGLLTQARDARSDVVAALTNFRTQLAAVGAAMQADATNIVAANDSASNSFRTAVTEAAGRVVSAQQAGGDGLAEMPAYAAAVDALRVENARILAIEEAEREAEPTTPRNPGGGTNSGGGSNSGNTNPGGSPSTAPTPAPQPSQPSPAPEPEPDPEPEPEPEPSQPQPSEPSEPSAPETPIIPGTNA